MSIKLDVSIAAFARAARSFKMPEGFGDIVYGWDDNSSVLVIGAHRGYDDAFDSKTGEQIKHRHKILVMSWEKPDIMPFDHAATVPMEYRVRVITPDGTGTLETVNDDSIKVLLDAGAHALYSNPDHVQLFNWDRINVTKTSND